MLQRSSYIIERFASKRIQPLSINDVIKFAQPADVPALLHSANWIQQEVPVRLAHRLYDFNRLPFVVVSNPHIYRVYELYLKAFEEIGGYGPIKDEKDNENFSAMLSTNVSTI